MTNTPSSIIITMFATLMLFACGGGDEGDDGGGNDGDDNENATAQAFFIDSPVYGLRYSSTSHSGFTGYTGEFDYTAGETTEFSLHGLVIGSVTLAEGASAVTPLDLFATTDVNNQSVANTLVLLQSFDYDQNPSNGITLPIPLDGITIDLSALNISASDFSDNLTPELTTYFGNNTLVESEDAIAHFEETQVKLNGTASMIGEWHMRSGSSNDLSAIYVFDANNGVTVTEFEDCPDLFWSSTPASTSANCTEVEFQQTWSLTNKTLSLTSEEISDSCTIISADTYLVEASCLFQGSGLGNELIRFERSVTQYTNALVNASYREVGLDTLSYTNLSFSSELTGSYTYIDSDGAPIGNGDQGSFTWSTSDSQLSVSGTDNADEAFTGAWSLVSALQGALMTTFDGDSAVLLPDFDTSLAAGVINQTVYAVYDGISGDCSGIYMFGDTVLRKEDSTRGTEICDFASPVTQPQVGDSGVYSVNIENGAFVLTLGESREVCWPYARINNEDGGGSTFLACSASNDSAHNFQIWRGL